MGGRLLVEKQNCIPSCFKETWMIPFPCFIIKIQVKLWEWVPTYFWLCSGLKTFDILIEAESILLVLPKGGLTANSNHGRAAVAFTKLYRWKFKQFSFLLPFNAFFCFFVQVAPPRLDRTRYVPVCSVWPINAWIGRFVSELKSFSEPKPASFLKKLSIFYLTSGLLLWLGY